MAIPTEEDIGTISADTSDSIIKIVNSDEYIAECNAIIQEIIKDKDAISFSASLKPECSMEIVKKIKLDGYKTYIGAAITFFATGFWAVAEIYPEYQWAKIAALLLTGGGGSLGIAGMRHALQKMFGEPIPLSDLIAEINIVDNKETNP